MKKLIYIFTYCLFCSITVFPESQQTSEISVSEYEIKSDIIDKLQRPLNFNLPVGFKNISRENFEYYVKGSGQFYWDLYVMSGKKLGNSMYEKKIEIKDKYQVVEICGLEIKSEQKVNMVGFVFTSSDKEYLEKLQTQFLCEAEKFFEKKGEVGEDAVYWDAGWVHYSSCKIQYSDNGNWIYLIQSLSFLNSQY